MLLPQVVSISVGVPRKLSLTDPSPCSFAGGSTSTSASSIGTRAFVAHKDRFCLDKPPQQPRYRVSLAAALGLASNIPVLTRVDGINKAASVAGDSSSIQSAETDSSSTPNACAHLANLCARLSPEAFAAAMNQAGGLAYEE